MSCSIAGECESQCCAGAALAPSCQSQLRCETVRLWETVCRSVVSGPSTERQSVSLATVTVSTLQWREILSRTHSQSLFITPSQSTSTKRDLKTFLFPWWQNHPSTVAACVLTISFDKTEKPEVKQRSSSILWCSNLSRHVSQWLTESCLMFMMRSVTSNDNEGLQKLLNDLGHLWSLIRPPGTHVGFFVLCWLWRNS